MITEGDLQADYFYVVESGRFEVTVSGEDHDDEKNREADFGKLGAANVVQVVEAGGTFGELALLYLVPRAATVTAKEASVVWVIDRGNFKKILMSVSEKKEKQFEAYLDNIESFDCLLAGEKRHLARALVEMRYDKDEDIIRQGEMGNTFFIMYEGEVEFLKDGERVGTERVTFGATPAIFGEKALIEGEARAATVRVISAQARILALDRSTFEVLLGPLRDLMAQAQGNRSETKLGGAESRMRALNQTGTRGHIKRTDLCKIGLLGCGGFGAVELFEHKDTKETYAMKALSKGFIVKTGMQESVMNEKNILTMTNSPFIIKLFETYNGSQTLYFLLEPALGGELYATYNRKGFHGSDRHAVYYSAGTVFAFEHLHQRHVIYRDLKPENLLLTHKGQIKLTDMGLAKFVVGKTYTTCGTPDYFAPGSFLQLVTLLQLIGGRLVC